MRSILTLPQLQLTMGGPISASEAVHLRQGDVDGACGPYSILICLLIHGVLGRDEVTSLDRLDGRTRLSKFWNNLSSFDSMVRDGTHSDHLEWLTSCFQTHPNGSVVANDIVEGTSSTKQKLAAIKSSLGNDSPVIVGLEWQGGGGHWAVVVGIEQIDDQITKLLLLDPGFETSKVASWNAVLSVIKDDGAMVNSGSLPCNHWGLNALKSNKCKLAECIEISVG